MTNTSIDSLKSTIDNVCTLEDRQKIGELQKLINNADKSAGEEDEQINSQERTKIIRQAPDRAKGFLIALKENATEKLHQLVTRENAITRLSNIQLYGGLQKSDIPFLFRQAPIDKVLQLVVSKQENSQETDLVKIIQTNAGINTDGKFGLGTYKAMCQKLGIKYENSPHGQRMEAQRIRENKAWTETIKDNFEQTKQEFDQLKKEFLTIFGNQISNIPAMEDKFTCMQQKYTAMEEMKKQYSSESWDNGRNYNGGQGSERSEQIKKMEKMKQNLDETKKNLDLCQKYLKQGEIGTDFFSTEKFSAQDLGYKIKNGLHLINKDGQRLARLGPYSIPAKSAAPLTTELIKIINQAPSGSEIKSTLFGDGLYVSVPFGEKTVSLSWGPNDFEKMGIKKEDFAKFTNQILKHRA